MNIIAHLKAEPISVVIPAGHVRKRPPIIALDEDTQGIVTIDLFVVLRTANKRNVLDMDIVNHSAAVIRGKSFTALTWSCSQIFGASLPVSEITF